MVQRVNLQVCICDAAGAAWVTVRALLGSSRANVPSSTPQRYFVTKLYAELPDAYALRHDVPLALLMQCC